MERQVVKSAVSRTLYTVVGRNQFRCLKTSPASIIQLFYFALTLFTFISISPCVRWWDFVSHYITDKIECILEIRLLKTWNQVPLALRGLCPGVKPIASGWKRYMYSSTFSISPDHRYYIITQKKCFVTKASKFKDLFEGYSHELL